MRNVRIIFKKQMKDTWKNKTIFIQFILFPILTLIMENCITLDGMPEHFFAKLFSVMYMGMAPITAMVAIISEEREKNTLRVLLMANVKPIQYLFGIGSYVWLICMGGALIMGAAAHFTGSEMGFFLAVLGIGFVISILAGAGIGILAENQMKGISMVMPVMMILSFLPMLSMFNGTIRKIAKFVYTQQINLCMSEMNPSNISREGIMVTVVNALAFGVLFIVAIRKNGLE